MRNKFDMDIKALKDMFITMGEKTKVLIKFSVDSLKEQDVEKAKYAIDLDNEIDELEYDIEQRCLSLIMLQQPLAKDLRIVGTLLKAITDMERIGDYGVNIAKITLLINDEKLIKPLVDIPKMVDIIEEMLYSCLKSFMEEDIQISYTVAEMDDKVDELYVNIYDELISIISCDTKKSKQVMNLLLVARHLERIADHIANICERIIYMVTGERVEIN